MWPSIRKHVLSTKAFFRGFEVTLKPFWNPVSEGLKPFGNAFETLWKHFWNPLETLWKPFWNALKPFGNPFETLWNPLETLWNPLETLSKCFETLWKLFWNALKPFRNALKLFGNPLKCLGTWEHFRNPLEMYHILFEKPLWKCRGKKYSCSLCSPSTCRRMRESTAYYKHILQTCYFAIWLSTNLFIVMEIKS